MDTFHININLTFVNEDKLPEIVGLSGEREIAHIFKIMDGEYFVDGYGVRQKCSFVHHVKPPASFCESILLRYLFGESPVSFRNTCEK